MTVDQILTGIAVAQPSRELAPWDNFVAQHPARAAWIDRSSGFDFAVSLRRQIENGRTLSEKQLAAVDRCMASDRSRVSTRSQAQAPVELGTAIHDALKVSGLKWPKLRVHGLVFSPAPAYGKNPGSVYVKSTGDVYYGRIDPQGRFLASGDATDEVKALVARVAADPAAEAALHGKETGRCSCCGLELTNPESIALGIGPICREKWGW